MLGGSIQSGNGHTNEVPSAAGKCHGDDAAGVVAECSQWDAYLGGVTRKDLSKEVIFEVRME